MTVISTDTVVVCIGTKRDCQSHRYLLLRQTHFFCVYFSTESRLVN